MTEKNSDRPEPASNYKIIWKDIELATKVAPNNHKKVLEWISFRLGYLPHESVYMPYLAFVQSMISELERTQIANEQTVDADIAIAKQIRNDDIKKGNWLESQFSEEKYRRAYDEILPVYKHKARELLCKNLGYQPLVGHSFEAEIYLRHMFTADEYHEGLKLCGMEVKAMTIAHYRGYYEIEGKKSADESVLIGLISNSWKEDNGIPLDL